MHPTTGTFRYRRLLRYARPYWRAWVVIAAITLLSTCLAVVQPWPMKLLVDNVLGGAPVTGGAANVMSNLPGAATRGGLLAWVVGASLAIFALNAAAEVVLTWSWIRAGQQMVYDLAADLFANVQRRSLLFHSRNSVGESMSRITGDSWCVYRAIDTLVFTPLQASLTLGCLLVLMFRMDVRLTLVSVAVIPLMAGSSFLLGRPLRAVARLRRDVEGRIQSHVHQTLSGIPVVQVFNQEQRQRQQFEEHAAEAIRAHGHNVFISSIGGLVTGALPTLGTAAVLWFGARQVLAGGLTLGALLVFLAYLRGLQLNAAKLTGLYATLQETRASADRVFELLEVEPEVRESPHAKALPRGIRGAVRFEDVTFGYEAGRPVLRNLSLAVEPGETVAIVGGSGAGKSTLAALVPRLFDPWSGRVLLDGHDVRGVTLGSLRGHIALVLQEPFLFPVSIAENIAYGRPGASAHEIESAARAAGAHAFIAALPAAYQTVVGARGGATLSGGERQRLSIARALLRDAPVLVLDEPTSALDAVTEASMLSALRGLTAGRTTLTIAHRLSTVRDADRIVVLAGGAVAEQGTHEQLLRSGGHYWRMYQILQGRAERAPHREVDPCT